MQFWSIKYVIKHNEKKVVKALKIYLNVIFSLVKESASKSLLKGPVPHKLHIYSHKITLTVLLCEFHRKIASANSE